MNCPKCGSQNTPDSRFCKTCGGRLLPHEKAPDSATLTFEIPAKELAVGTTLAGRYKLIEELGKGGMGSVFLAEQVEPVKRRVALKIIKLGMDTKEVVARFEAERQALAVMDHPHIAKVYDAGATETGRPYFVMEFVRGIPLTQYCDKNKLSTSERLELFIPICQAVQHAHQKGVIHRDLKPSNVLVTVQDGRAVPKIIDFGIAKAVDHRLTERTLFTEQGQFIGTPEYMSPEQAEMSGLDIDTRSDIYSLGIMLYELLVGVLPFDPKSLRSAAFGEIQRIIRETDPPKASTRLVGLGETRKTIAELRRTEPGLLQRELKGDLDWIIMRAMEKDRTRRYETANGLAMDIRRHINCEPILARPPRAAYKMAKFVRRHKGGFAAGTAVACALVIGLVLATTGLIRARRAEAVAAGERDRANQEAVAAGQVSDFLVGLFKVSDPSEALGNTITAREILDKGSARMKDELEEQPQIRARLMDTMGVVYRNLGLYRQSTLLLEQALETRRLTLGSGHPSVAESLANLAQLRYATGDYRKAAQLFREALEIRRKSSGGDDLKVSESLNDLAISLNALGRYAEAEPLYRQALAIRQKLLGDQSPEVAQSLNNLGMFLYRTGALPEAEQLFRKALEVNNKLLGTEHPELAANYNNLGLVLRDSGKLPEAEEAFEQTLTMDLKFYGPDHPEYANSLVNLAALQARMGKYAEAEKNFNEGIVIRSRVFGDDHWNTAAARSLLGGCLTLEKKYAQAERLLTESLAIVKKQFGLEHPRTQAALRRVVELYDSWGKPKQAAAYRAGLKGNT
jgi:tetratricopeptide (TPR) repeat protein/predicted Ser/Thr protein kinase